MYFRVAPTKYAVRNVNNGKKDIRALSIWTTGLILTLDNLKSNVEKNEGKSQISVNTNPYITSHIMFIYINIPYVDTTVERIVEIMNIKEVLNRSGFFIISSKVFFGL